MKLYSISLFFMSLLLVSCGKFTPFSDSINSNSDGSYAVETTLSDKELLEYGLVTVYRFQSVSNLVAVRQMNTGSPAIVGQFSAPNLINLIQKNVKNRAPANTSKVNNVNDYSCYSAYCEAGFNAALNQIQSQSLTLNAVPIAVVDSGVLPATTAIKKILYSSSNVSGDTNVAEWLPHATMISSLFAGVMNSSYANPNDIYAPNAQVHSIKITFAGDPDTSVEQQYGSMQLAVALDKAVAVGAKVVNLSLTYANKPDDNIALVEQGIMSAAAQQGVLFVAAAGNNDADIDSTPVYPAAYNVNNLIVVGSHTSNLQKASTSNYGASVDLTAQGASITVNDKTGEVETAGGTSFAAPLVVSALSLYLGVQQQTNITPNVNQILGNLFNSSNNYYAYGSGAQISNYGRLNTQGFVQLAVN
ncbi:MAG: S8/S53 family peptidase [Bdellovibrionota bacterium]